MKYICKQCGKTFEISDSEIQFFKSKNLSIPKRCKECRELNKKQKNNNSDSNDNNSNISTSNNNQNNSTHYEMNVKPKINPVVAVVVVAVILIAALIIPNFKTIFFGGDYSSTITENTTISDTYLIETQKAETVQAVADSTTEDEYVKIVTDAPTEAPASQAYYFRSDKLLTQHYEKHGIEMGFSSKEEYESAASAVIENPNSLHKTEAEDCDDVYYNSSTGEFVILSTDGYIRTYYYADYDYYERQ